MSGNFKHFKLYQLNVYVFVVIKYSFKAFEFVALK